MTKLYSFIKRERGISKSLQKSQKNGMIIGKSYGRYGPPTGK